MGDTLNIGLRIKELRQIHNLSSKQLAKLINSSQSVISKLENNNRIPDVPTLEKICKVFDISLSEFFDDRVNLPSELQELLYNAKKLSTNQLNQLNKFLKTIIEE